MIDDEVLVSTDHRGSWGWAGFRLTPVLGLEATYQYADLTQEERAARVAAAESAWLAAQWTEYPPPGGMHRFELRYRNDPAAGPASLRCACLCRVRGGTREAVVEHARWVRDSLAGALPSHVRAEPLADAMSVRDWLVPFDGPTGPESQIELVKRISWQRTVRQDTGRNATILVSRLSPRRVSWEPALRQLAALPFPAILTVGFEPFPRNPSFRAGLQHLASQYSMLAGPAKGLYSGSTPPDPFAGYASRCYGLYAQKYDGPAFRVRISLAGQQDLPGPLGAWLANALSGAGGAGTDSGGASGAVALRPAPHERTLAWTNLATLGASWLGETYRGPLPDSALGPLERELLNLVDREEASSLVQLPVAWPGHTPLYAGLAAAPSQESDDFGLGAGTSSWGASTRVVEPEGEDPALKYRRRPAANLTGEHDG